MNEPEKTLDDWSTEEWDLLLGEFIERGDDEIDLPTFFDLLTTRSQAPPPETVRVAARVENGQLRLLPAAGVQVRNNEIWIGSMRVVIDLQLALSAAT
jgi:hypothetical protein